MTRYKYLSLWMRHLHFAMSKPVTNPRESWRHPDYRPDIDGMRAFAVLVVVAFHAFPQEVSGGFIGVDIFFVISGYLISSILFRSLEKDDFSFREFYARRVRRIFPSLILVLIVTMGLGWVALPPLEYGELGTHVLSGIAFVSNFTLWKEAGYFDGAAESKPLLHLWSLGIEEQFYILWPLLLYLAWRRKLDPMIMTLLLAAGSFVLNMHVVQQDNVAAFYSPQTRFWELLCGGLLAGLSVGNTGWFVKVRRYAATQIVNHKALANVASALGCVLVVLALHEIDKSTPFPGAWAGLPVAGSLLIIGAGREAWINRVLLSSRVAVWFGLISFPLYLWHWPLLAFARLADGGTPDVNVRGAAVLLATLLAWLTFELVEKPVRFGGRARWKTGVLVVFMAGVGAAGYFAQSIKVALAGADPVSKMARQLKWEIPVGSAEQKTWCRQRFPERDQLASRQRNDNFCLLQKNAEANVLLVGDSLNLSLFPGLAKYDDYNLLLLSASSAAPFYDVRTTESYDRVRELNFKLTNHALDYAVKSDTIKVVVMSFMGGPLITKPHSSFTIVDVLHPDRKDAHAIFSESMTRTLEKLVDKGKAIIVVLPNPELNFEPRSCLPFNRVLGSGAIDEPCSQTSDAHLRRGGKAYREWVASILKKFPQVEVFDAAQAVCDTSLCWAKRDGKLLYRDTMHLSDDGSTLAAPYLHEMIVKRLNSP